ncbi:hypothetical protein SLEP1_g41813 [Rubroshorea leprosula]|uniref:Uncharacterized protein n=1 Tax=Rubroshorea leprosula TaxID=152421 RepID=A0AAV5L822_9ROSI|nr:hypothetical protein SLEP1_g41813 [Rubroshorea leprosula]
MSAKCGFYFSPCVFLILLRYEEAKAKGIDNYDRELEDASDRLIVECDRKIGRALKRLDDEDAKAAIAISVTEVTQTPEVLEFSNQIKGKLKEADQYGEKWMIDEAQEALEEAEALKRLLARQEPVLDSSKYTAADVRITDQKLWVCDICGAVLSVYDRLLGPVLRG